VALTASCALATAPASQAGASTKTPIKPAGPPVNVVLTTANLRHALTAMPREHFAAPVASRLRVLRVDDTVRYQQMVGFGAAMTDSSAWLLYDQLAPATRAQAIGALFSPAGIHLDFTRVPIGASDFTVGGQPYTYDDVPAGESDPQLADFSIAHDEAYIIPVLQQMLSVDPAIDVLATPWSPPAWMKINQSLDDVDWGGAVFSSDYQPLADYFVKFIQAYQSQGVPIWGITPENEPEASTTYPGSLMGPQDEIRFITQNLAPSLAAAGLQTRIYGSDNVALLPYAQALLASPAAGSLSGIAWHCYGGEQVMGVLHEIYPAVQQIMTECSPGIIPYQAAEAAISGARNWASTIALWNLALDPSGGPVQAPNSGCPGCTGLLTISEQTHTVRYSLSYYQLGQLSKFVAPGAVRIGSDRWVSEFRTGAGAYGVTPGLDNVAFLNPGGTRVLIAYDNSGRPARFAVAWHGREFAYALAPRATVTFTWRSRS
jgi:glucosylceramidase